MTTHFRTCPLCEAMCGLEIEVEGDRVTRVRGDRQDVWSKGFLCPKGATLGELHHDPDRLRAPLVKRDGAWAEVTWEEAFARCEELLAPIVAEHGMGAVTAYLGNPNVHNYSLSRYSGAIPGLPQMPVTWSAGTVDQWPKNLVCAQLYGMGLTSGDFADLTADLLELAPPGRRIAFLEGGYDLEALASCAAACVGALLGERHADEAPTSGGPGREVAGAAARVRETASG